MIEATDDMKEGDTREIEAREVPEPRETSTLGGKMRSIRDTVCCQQKKCPKIAGWYWRRARRRGNLSRSDDARCDV